MLVVVVVIGAHYDSAPWTPGANDNGTGTATLLALAELLADLEPERVDGAGWSDHWSFWQCGYPGVIVTDTAPFRYPHYHRPTDTPDRIDYDRLARVVVGLRDVILEISSPTR